MYRYQIKELDCANCARKIEEKLNALPDGIRLSKRAMKIIHFNLCFAIGVKLLVFTLAFFGLGQIWMAVFADVGVSLLSVLHATSLLQERSSLPPIKK